MRSIDECQKAQFSREFDVSRETMRRLETYLGLLCSWNQHINLVSGATLAGAWTRHFADSAQLLEAAPRDASTWIDLGSGAGFPALPVAALATDIFPHLRITLVESDRRKVAFLRTAAREMGIDPTIEPRRIEALQPRPYDIVSARALAPLARLCTLALPFKGPKTTFLFPKGARLDSELTEAEKHWHIRFDRIPSRTHPDATILRIGELERRK